MKIKTLKRMLVVLWMILLVSPTTTIDAQLMSTDATLDTKDEEKILCKATIKDDFLDDSVVIVLKEEVSNDLKSYSKDDFSEVNIEAVDDLTKYSVTKKKKQRKKNLNSLNMSEMESVNELLAEDNIETDKFNQILKIDLKVRGKDNVLKTIRELEKRDDILSVEPNYIIHINVTPNDPRKTEQWAINKMSLPSIWDITNGSNNVTDGVLGNFCKNCRK